MITVIISPGKIKITGHAGYADAGKDIVCAAVSGIVYTLLANAPDVQKVAPGDVEITCDNQLIVFAGNGLKAIAGAYPDNVRVITAGGL